MQSIKKRTEGFTSLSHKDKGFTIIEVMIVLVIAAVIILIVFLAVPALQRNSRNNQRKSDAARVLAAANEWRTTHSNAFPDGENATNVTEVGALAGKLGFFEGINIAPYTGGYTDLTGNEWADPTKVNLVTSAACGSSISSKKPGTGIIAVYQIETGSTTQWQCI